MQTGLFGHVTGNKDLFLLGLDKKRVFVIAYYDMLYTGTPSHVDYYGENGKNTVFFCVWNTFTDIFVRTIL